MDNIVLIDSDASTIAGVNGWACIVVNGDNEQLYSGWTTGLTNNEAELFAILMGLLFAPHNSKVLIWSDSRTALSWFWRRPENDKAREIYWAIRTVRNESNLTIFKTQKISGHKNNHTHSIVDVESRRMANIGYKNAIA